MKKGLLAKIISISVSAVLISALAVGDYIAIDNRQYISNFLGLTEQMDGDKTQIDKTAKNGDTIVQDMAKEGFVLLKNDKNKNGETTLPLKKENKKVNLFGWYATDAGFLLTGNGSARSAIYPDSKVTLLQAFKDAGVEYNEDIINKYVEWQGPSKDWGEYADWTNRDKTELKSPVTEDFFTDDMISKAQEFSDTAVVVISRYQGEYIGNVKSYQQKKGLPTDETRYINQISTEEESLLKLCTSKFNNVIVLINSGTRMDLSFLDDEEKVGHIGAAFNISYVGQSGARAIPALLYGDVSPSAKVTDTFAYDFLKDSPGIYNNKDTSTSVLQEDIYVGYRYYETADTMGYFNDRTRNGKTGYDAVVQYPFGYGLSYTSFKWELLADSVTLPESEPFTKQSKIEFKVRVTNTGTVAGKDVVEVYYTPEYKKGGTEKSSINLMDFGKTEELKPGESQDLSFSFIPYDFASYDAYDKNENGMTGWEIDQGSYQIKLMTDSHHLKEMNKNTLTYEAPLTFRYNKDPVTNKRIRNRFTGATAYGGLPLDGSTLNAEGGKPWTYLSRADIAGTIPTKKATPASDSSLAPYKDYVYDNYPDYTTNPVLGQDNGLRLVTKEDGSSVTNDEFDGKSGGFTLKYNDELVQKLGKDYDDPDWDKLLDQLTFDDISRLVSGSGYRTQSAQSVGKPASIEYDGPSGYNRTNLSPTVEGSKFTAFGSEILVGQTWNKDLAFKMGQIIGSDGQNFSLGGIYAPGINIHRDPLNGRDYEYYSEDPVLSGKLAAYFVKGAKSNGIRTYLKHLALYDSSNWNQVFCTEQALREIYLKPFEIAIKEGSSNGIMTSFNKIGPWWSGGLQAMNEGIIRGEWGFRGAMITDYNDGTGGYAHMNVRAGIRGGNDTWLNPKFPVLTSVVSINQNDPVEMNRAKIAAKNVLFAFCDTYQFAKNYTGKDELSAEISKPKTITTKYEWWIPVVISLNCAVALGCGLWIFFAFYNDYKRKKKQTK